MSLIPLLLVLLAHAPLLFVYFQQLWGRPHYQFFPLVLAAAAWFVWQRWPLRLPMSTRWQLLARVLLLLSVGLLGLAFVRLSPVLAYVSFLLVLGSVLLRWGVPGLGPWLLLWLLVRIPYGQDVALIQWMQRLTTRLSSTALDRLGIEHIADGNVLLFPTTSLFVEEACSGVVSLLTIVACGGILAVWWRRSIVHAICLLGTAIFLAGAMNVVRVVTIALALDGFGIDLTEGWRHDGLGLVIFAISILALVSIDRVLSFFLAPITLNPLAGYWDQAEGNVLVSLWNRYVGLEPFDDEFAPDEDDEPAPSESSTAGRAGRFLGAGLDWALAGLFLLIGAGQVLAGIGPFSIAPDVSAIALEMSAESLPEGWQQWQQANFESLERTSSSAFGEHSRIWTFHNDQVAVQLSLDFVFPEWHALYACYAGIGWTPQGIQTIDAPRGGPLVEAHFSQPGGERALLLYDLFDEEGRPYEAPAGSFVHPTLRRIFGGESSRWTLPNYYQVQALVVVRQGELPPAQRAAVQELFCWFRQSMAQQIGGNASSTESPDAPAPGLPPSSAQDQAATTRLPTVPDGARHARTTASR